MGSILNSISKKYEFVNGVFFALPGQLDPKLFHRKQQAHFAERRHRRWAFYIDKPKQKNQT